MDASDGPQTVYSREGPIVSALFSNRRSDGKTCTQYSLLQKGVPYSAEIVDRKDGVFGISVTNTEKGKEVLFQVPINSRPAEWAKPPSLALTNGHGPAYNLKIPRHGIREFMVGEDDTIRAELRDGDYWLQMVSRRGEIFLE
jgi:hypothetical protein